ncbi:MAG TPA: hypothetical protein VE988_09740, partial [Gemmataceae bacterium]|nr:hypothetical protein [Gemmataceae bacterium]
MKRLAKKHTFKPTMEALESRWCPATTVSPLQNGVVTITGDETVNTVAITQNDNLNKLVIKTEGSLSYSDALGRTVINTVHEFSSDQVTDVVINLKGGNDQLTYQLGGGSDFINAKRIKVDLGSGDDVATFNFADNGAGGLAKVCALNLDIQAGAGKDQVDAYFGSVVGDVGRGYGATRTGNMGYG